MSNTDLGPDFIRENLWNPWLPAFALLAICAQLLMTLCIKSLAYQLNLISGIRTARMPGKPRGRFCSRVHSSVAMRSTHWGPKLRYSLTPLRGFGCRNRSNFGTQAIQVLVSTPETGSCPVRHLSRRVDLDVSRILANTRWNANGEKTKGRDGVWSDYLAPSTTGISHRG